MMSIHCVDSVQKNYEPKVCPRCGAPLHRNGSITTTLRHIPFGDSYSLVEADRPRFRCSCQGGGIQ